MVENNVRSQESPFRSTVSQAVQNNEPLSINWFHKHGLLPELVKTYKGNVNEAVRAAMESPLLTEDIGENEKDKIRLTQKQYLAARAHFQLVNREDATQDEAYEELYHDEIATGKHRRYVIFESRPHLYGAIPKMGRAFSIFSQDSQDFKLPFTEEQLETFEQYSPETRDFYERLGRKYPAMSVEEILKTSCLRKGMKKMSLVEKLEIGTGNIMDRKRSEAEKTVEELNNPDFWQEFAADLLAIEDNEYSFSQYMQFIDVEKREQGIPFWRGRYDDVYSYIATWLYFQQVPKDGREFTYTPVNQKICELFMQKAPPLLKGLLISKFEAEFSQFTKDFSEVTDGIISDLESKGVLKNILSPLLRSLSVFTSDRQKLVLGTLGNFLQGQVEGDLATAELITNMFSLRVKEYQRAPESAEFSQQKIRLVKQFKGLAELQEGIDQDHSQKTEELLTIVEDEIVVPLVISEVYKPASLFWLKYFNEGKGDRTTVGESLDRFLFVYLKKKMSLSTGNGKEDGTIDYNFNRYFDRKILPKVRSYFHRIATHYGEVKYFPDVSPYGNPRYLYLHQVENIKRLTEQGSGILADEPGIGKTLTLALTALNLIDRKESEGKGRVLVVAGKSVIDNWERELLYHLPNNPIDIININTPPSPSSPSVRLSENATVPRRLAGMKQVILHPQNPKQIFLVNYDLFRDKQFIQLLENHPFDSVIIDEAHHVKTRDLSILESLEGFTPEKKFAQRTLFLYQFIRNNPSMSVFFATATPVVKTNIEPLILAHLANPKLFDLKTVTSSLDSEEKTHRSLRQIMVRRRKSEVANLPDKETKIIPISLTKLNDREREAFTETAQALMETTGGNYFSEFYALLSLESLVKLSWLKAKVSELTAKGKKVLIFTPFVYDENRYTGPMGSIGVAKYLKQQGVGKVGILDGSLPLKLRSKVQEQFKLPMSDEESLDAIVGNYDTAGESITLCSPYNRATEVILFVSPNTISRFMQSVDRVHRFGQTENVTIHIPVVTDDILGREKGTYDERIVKRLFRELSNFDRVIDGLFYIESKDIYQEIARDKEEKAVFSHQTEDVLDRIGKKSHEQVSQEIIFPKQERQTVRESKVSQEIEAYIKKYITSLGPQELLTQEQERELGLQVQAGLAAESELEPKESLMTDEEKNRLFEIVRKAREAEHMFIMSNQRLVAANARRYHPYNLTIDELINEGNIGLITAVRKFDPALGFKFSTYATHWIRQAMGRAIYDKDSPIRIPVYLHELLGKAQKVSDQFYGETGNRLSPDELEQRLVEDLFINPDTAHNVVRTLNSGLNRITSLDRYIGDDETATLADFVADPKSYFSEEVEEQAAQVKVREEVSQILGKVLSERERWVIEQRFMTQDDRRALRELGEEKNLSHERIRQIEERSLERLRESEELTTIWDRYKDKFYESMPRYLYNDPQEIFTSERAVPVGYYRSSIIEPIFSLSQQQAKIAYRRLYLGLTSQQVAEELHIVKESVDEYFNSARITLWENNHIKYLLNSNEVRNSVVFFPDLDPDKIKFEYQKISTQLEEPVKRAFERFFGFDGKKGYFSTKLTAGLLRISPEQVKQYLERVLKMLNS